MPALRTRFVVDDIRPLSIGSTNGQTIGQQIDKQLAEYFSGRQSHPGDLTEVAVVFEPGEVGMMLAAENDRKSSKPAR